MELKFEDSSLDARICLTDQSEVIHRAPNLSGEHYTILWNLNTSREVRIDGIPYRIDENEITCVTPYQKIQLPKEADGEVRAFIFSRGFYCIHENDREVSCEGLLFYGSSSTSRLKLQSEEKNSFETLYSVFLEEMQTRDSIQGEMLRMLLKRLIIKCTRLVKSQKLPAEAVPSHLEVIRKFNVLVEQHFREKKRVKEYAEMLYRSPKTLSHIFEKSYHLTPMEVIHQRVDLEARRLLSHTEMTVQEIAFELGFSDAASFSRYFKNQSGVSPREFRAQPPDNGKQEKMTSFGESR